jgi:hypothetical protein
MMKVYIALGFICFFQAVTSNAGEPCEPSKCQTCGRLVISIVGAGDVTDDSNRQIDTPVYNARHSAEAYRHLLQFTAGKDATLPSKHIVITSDPYFKNWLKSLPFSPKVSLVGIVDNSIPAFDRMIDPSSKDSPLNRALSAFKKNTGCRWLMGKSDNVLPFLKVDIIVDGELAEANESSKKNRVYGISTFRNEGTVGTYEKWMREGNVIGKDELSKLMRRLSGSLAHIFVKTCKAGLIGNLFDSAMEDAGVCGCYVGVSDEDQIHYSGGTVGMPAFNYAMANQGKEFRKIAVSNSFGKWQTNTSMVNMEAALLDQHKILVMNAFDPESTDTAVLKPLKLHRNPLFGFGYTSADALTNKALALLQQNPSTSELAKQITDSEFISEVQQIPIKPYTSGAGPEVDAKIKRIRTLLAEARNQLRTLIDNNPKEKLDTTIFDSEVANFYSCLKSSNAENDFWNEFCATIRNDIEQINKKIGSHSQLSPDETVFRHNYGTFLRTLKDLKFEDLWKQYLKGEIP